MRASVDLALIGHQESWEKIESIVTALRMPTRAPLPLETLKEIVPWIPPRTVTRARFPDANSQAHVSVAYIDTFITPDELGRGELQAMVAKVHDAVRVAEREGAKLGALGGFSSIVLEGKVRELSSIMQFTTGNSLTAGFIAKGVARAAEQIGISIGDARLLVIGASGDVGSAAARYLAPRVSHTMLAARSALRLQATAASLAVAGASVEIVTNLETAVASADIIIAAASTSEPIRLTGVRPGTLVCDAGHPRNTIVTEGESAGAHVFWGGMGVSAAGIGSDDGMIEVFYRFPVAGVAHGCLLEGVVLALAGRNESYSAGRGAITATRMDEIVSLAERFGYTVAPFFNALGLWTTESAIRAGNAGATAPAHA